MILATIYLVWAAATPHLPAGSGATIVQHRCTSCHAMSVVTSKRASKPQWTQLVNQMVARGAQIPDNEIPSVIEYLAANFNLASPPARETVRASSGPKLINVNAATAKQLSFAFGLTAQEADAVLEYRAQHGKIRNWDALTRMPGVTATKFKDKKSLIRY
jgi:DNA uptake protein ComE-like DNA-binding protein